LSVSWRCHVRSRQLTSANCVGGLGDRLRRRPDLGSMSRDAPSRPPPATAPRRGRTAARRKKVPEPRLGDPLPDSIQLTLPLPTFANNESDEFLLNLVAALAREAAKRDHEATGLPERRLP
jgi:hypothetical protein